MSRKIAEYYASLPMPAIEWNVFMTTKPTPYHWFLMPHLNPPTPEQLDFTIEEPRMGGWKYGYCGGCDKELTPALDGDKAEFCRDCFSELPF